MIVCQGIRKHHIHFMAKAELFEIPVLKHVIRWLKAFPVSRGTGDTTAIETAMQVIRDGEVLGCSRKAPAARTAICCALNRDLR